MVKPKKFEILKMNEVEMKATLPLSFRDNGRKTKDGERHEMIVH